jgi:hypothetical protein
VTKVGWINEKTEAVPLKGRLLPYFFVGNAKKAKKLLTPESSESKHFTQGVRRSERHQ